MFLSRFDQPHLPSSKSFLIAGVTLCASIPSSVSLAEELCEAPAKSCASVMPPACLDRVGASSLSTAEAADCGVHLKNYRACLTTVIGACQQEAAPEASRRTLPPGDMLEIWNEVKDSGDPDALEAFARDYEGASLGVLAAKRAAELRARERDAAAGRKAAAVWSHLKDVQDPEVLEAFAQEFPGTPQAELASAIATELRAGTDQRGVARRKKAEPPSPQPAEDPTASARSQAEIEADAKAAAEAAKRDARHRAAQTELNRLGYDAGQVDGDFGPLSKAALTAFQRAEGLTPDGRLTAAALAALRAAPTPETPPATATEAEAEAEPPVETAEPAEKPEASVGAAEQQEVPEAAAASPSPTAPDSIDARLTWSIRRADGEIIGACAATLLAAGPANNQGQRTYFGEGQRCGADDISYRLIFDPEGETLEGELRIITFKGRSPNFELKGQLPLLETRLAGSTVKATFQLP